jgi:hypothetical protein
VLGVPRALSSPSQDTIRELQEQSQTSNRVAIG